MSDEILLCGTESTQVSYCNGLASNPHPKVSSPLHEEARFPINFRTIFQSLGKYSRLLRVLETIGCCAQSPDGRLCECLLFKRTFGESASPTDDFLSDSQLLEKIAILKDSTCRKCSHTAGDHLKLLKDELNDEEIFEIIMLARDFNRLRNFVEFEKEPIAKEAYKRALDIYHQLLYGEPRLMLTWPHSMASHYIDPPFESPSIEYIILNACCYFNQLYSDSLLTSVRCVKYFLHYLNNVYEMPRCDSEFYNQLPLADKALYRAFYELWIVFCYLPEQNTFLQKYRISRIFGGRLLSIISSNLLFSMWAHLSSLSVDERSVHQLAPFCLQPTDFETFQVTLSTALDHFDSHLYHVNYIPEPFTEVYSISIPNSPNDFASLSIQSLGDWTQWNDLKRESTHSWVQKAILLGSQTTPESGNVELRKLDQIITVERLKFLQVENVPFIPSPVKLPTLNGHQTKKRKTLHGQESASSETNGKCTPLTGKKECSHLRALLNGYSPQSQTTPLIEPDPVSFSDDETMFPPKSTVVAMDGLLAFLAADANNDSDISDSSSEWSSSPKVHPIKGNGSKFTLFGVQQATPALDDDLEDNELYLDVNEHGELISILLNGPKTKNETSIQETKVNSEDSLYHQIHFLPKMNGKSLSMLQWNVSIASHALAENLRELDPWPFAQTKFECKQSPESHNRLASQNPNIAALLKSDLDESEVPLKNLSEKSLPSPMIIKLAPIPNDDTASESDAQSGLLKSNMRIECSKCQAVASKLNVHTKTTDQIVDDSPKDLPINIVVSKPSLNRTEGELVSSRTYQVTLKIPSTPQSGNTAVIQIEVTNGAPKHMSGVVEQIKKLITETCTITYPGRCWKCKEPVQFASKQVLRDRPFTIDCSRFGQALRQSPAKGRFTSDETHPFSSASRRLFTHPDPDASSPELAPVNVSPGKSRSDAVRRSPVRLYRQGRKLIDVVDCDLSRNGRSRTSPKKGARCQQVLTNGVSQDDRLSDSTVIDSDGSENGVDGLPQEEENEDSSEGEAEIEIVAHTHLYESQMFRLTNRAYHTEESKRKVLYYMELQNVISNQLPNMGHDYIKKLLKEPDIRSIVLIKKKRLIGAITFRTFPRCNFTEIIFCVVATREQIKGHGSVMMNLVKQYSLGLGINKLLTYADKYALRFFTRNRFTKTVTTPKSVYGGKIILCTGADLMECSISANFKCPADYAVSHPRQCLDRSEMNNENANAKTCEAKLVNGFRHSSPTKKGPGKRSRKEVLVEPLATFSPPAVPKKRGRRPLKMTTANFPPLPPAVGPSADDWQKMDDFLVEFRIRKGACIFHSVEGNSKVLQPYPNVVGTEEIFRVHASKSHYQTPLMLYYDLMIILRSFQYVYKKCSGPYRTAYRLERFVKRQMLAIFGIDETL